MFSSGLSDSFDGEDATILRRGEGRRCLAKMAQDHFCLRLWRKRAIFKSDFFQRFDMVWGKRERVRNQRISNVPIFCDFGKLVMGLRTKRRVFVGQKSDLGAFAAHVDEGWKSARDRRDLIGICFEMNHLEGERRNVDLG